MTAVRHVLAAASLQVLLMSALGLAPATAVAQQPEVKASRCGAFQWEPSATERELLPEHHECSVLDVFEELEERLDFGGAELSSTIDLAPRRTDCERQHSAASARPSSNAVARHAPRGPPRA